MMPPTYCYTIRFLGSAYPKARYQLQISEISHDGCPHYRAQWDFLTLRSVLMFLKKYFPNSYALAIPGEERSLSFEKVVTTIQ